MPPVQVQMNCKAAQWTATAAIYDLYAGYEAFTGSTIPLSINRPPVTSLFQSYNIASLRLQVQVNILLTIVKFIIFNEGVDAGRLAIRSRRDAEIPSDKLVA